DAGGSTGLARFSFVDGEGDFTFRQSARAIAEFCTEQAHGAACSRIDDAGLSSVNTGSGNNRAAEFPKDFQAIAELANTGFTNQRFRTIPANPGTTRTAPDSRLQTPDVFSPGPAAACPAPHRGRRRKIVRRARIRSRSGSARST